VETIAIASSASPGRAGGFIIAGWNRINVTGACNGVQNRMNYKIATETTYLSITQHGFDCGRRVSEAVSTLHEKNQDQSSYESRSESLPLPGKKKEILKHEVVPITVKETYVDENMKNGKRASFVVATMKGFGQTQPWKAWQN